MKTGSPGPGPEIKGCRYETDLIPIQLKSLWSNEITDMTWLSERATMFFIPGACT